MNLLRFYRQISSPLRGSFDDLKKLLAEIERRKNFGTSIGHLREKADGDYCAAREEFSKNPSTETLSKMQDAKAALDRVESCFNDAAQACSHSVPRLMHQDATGKLLADLAEKVGDTLSREQEKQRSSEKKRLEALGVEEYQDSAFVADLGNQAAAFYARVSSLRSLLSQNAGDSMNRDQEGTRTIELLKPFIP